LIDCIYNTSADFDNTDYLRLSLSMQKLIIQGGRPLNGEITISGAKNAALPILCASLLTHESLKISNVPALHDISTMLSLLKQIGTGVATLQSSEVILTAAHLTSLTAPYEMVKTMRAAILVLGPLLARAGRSEYLITRGMCDWFATC
jgi:UDP-N-acetylglucosamine 1-carboxyvinyltransferase